VRDSTFAPKFDDIEPNCDLRVDVRDNTTTEDLFDSNTPSEFSLALLPATVADSCRHHEVRNSLPEVIPSVSPAHDEIELYIMNRNISPLHPAGSALRARMGRGSVSSDLAMSTNVGNAARIQNLGSANLGAFVLLANGESR
jgi:hypothetical protein